MRIEFVCDTNASIPFVNTALFRTAHGDVTIDRYSTYYAYDPEEERLEMYWVGCYVWDNDKENFDMAEQISDEITALVSLEIEDDADDVLCEDEYDRYPYYCRPLVRLVDGREIPVLQEDGKAVSSEGGHAP